MTQQSNDRRLGLRADVASGGNAPGGSIFDSALRKFRNELDARILDRFGVAYQDSADHEPDPDVLADLALQRALMP
jgi:hypothetical protein